VAAHLGTTLGKTRVKRFADGEIMAVVEENVNGKHVYLIQPTSPPVNDSLMELILLVSAARRSGAAKITCVVPYYGYARQDRRGHVVAPISAADVLNMLKNAGADRVMAVDLHCN